MQERGRGDCFSGSEGSEMGREGSAMGETGAGGVASAVCILAAFWGRES